MTLKKNNCLTSFFAFLFFNSSTTYFDVSSIRSAMTKGKLYIVFQVRVWILYEIFKNGNFITILFWCLQLNPWNYKFLAKSTKKLHINLKFVAFFNFFKKLFSINDALALSIALVKKHFSESKPCLLAVFSDQIQIARHFPIFISFISFPSQPDANKKLEAN